MRGKRARLRFADTPTRIIPAHAGQTVFQVVFDARDADHPRACGANSMVMPPLPMTDGSSPRMRGKQIVERDLPHPVRIIPAHAGQTRRFFASPRHAVGSSPRMRGKQRRTKRRILTILTVRIIPAHAGQTPWRGTPRPCRSDHPRACGANSVIFSVSLRVIGSSPRMRGKRRRRTRHVGAHRIIPAHAGQTV